MSTDITMEEIVADHKKLLKETDLLATLQKERCWSLASIQQHGIGLTADNAGHTWLSIPVLSSSNTPLYCKLRKSPNAPAEQPKSKLPPGSSAAFYPLHLFNTNAESIIWVGGEPDVIAARSIGLNAASSTAGERHFDDKCLDYIGRGSSQKSFFCMLDNDDTGLEASEDICRRVLEQYPAWKIYKVQWPQNFPKGGDVTDFFKDYTGDDAANALLALCEEYKPKTPQQLVVEKLRQPQPTFFLPIQDFLRGTAYVTVTLMEGGSKHLYIITSERDIFECTEKVLAAKNMNASRLPVVTAMQRWQQDKALSFVEGADPAPLKATYHRIVDLTKKLIDLQEPSFYDVFALWIIGTYFYRLFPAYPYIHLTGLWGTGKTKFLQIAAHLGFNAELFTSASSPASIVRLIHANSAMCCVDEAEKLTAKKSNDNDVLAEVLRVGYKRGVTVRKCEGSDGKFEILELDPYSPKILAGISDIEAALASRCIRIETRRTDNEAIANSTVSERDPVWSDIRGDLYASFLTHAEELSVIADGIKVDSIKARAAELWMPILSIAQLVDESGELFTSVLTFAEGMEAERKEEEQDTTVHQVLIGIYELLDKDDVKFVSAESIFNHLAEDDENDWLLTENGTKRRGKWLNKNLRLLGLWKGRAKLKSVQGIKQRGYTIKREKVTDAARRYGVNLPMDDDTPIKDLSPQQIQATFIQTVPTVTDD